MKSAFLFLLLTTSLTAFAQGGLISSGIEDTVKNFCPEARLDRKADVAYCKASNAKEVTSATAGSNVSTQERKSLGIITYGAVDAGLVPDADSNTAYFYTRWLVNSVGKKVGIVTFEGWYNTEMEVSARFIIRYNLEGEVVSVSSTNI